MSQRRTVILLVAIVVGAVAAFLLFNYVRGIEDRANRGATLVTAIQAREPIPRGTEGSDAVSAGQVGPTQVPANVKPSTAISTLDEIELKVALFDIAENTVIVQGMFVDRAEAAVGFRQRLKNPMQTAITIDVAGARAVGGFLVGGDRVNMMIFEDLAALEGIEVPAEGEAPPAGGLSVLTQSARYLYQDVLIVAVGGDVLPEPGETVEGASQVSQSLITLVVPPRAAQWIASFDSNFYLALTPDDYEPKAITPLPNPIDLLPGENPALLTPYCDDEFGDDPDECFALEGAQ